MEVDIRNINFGCSDAHTECEDYPELLSDGYMDLSNVVNKALNTSAFLFLGYKGSGKSSLSEHLRLIDDKSIFVDNQRLTNFSFSSFSKIFRGEGEKEIQAQDAWRWILCVKVLQNLIKDTDAHTNDVLSLNKAVTILTQAGILPILDVSSLVTHSTSTKFKASVKAFEFEHQINSENTSVHISMATSFIKELLITFKEGHSHLIIIDDIDDILHPNGTQYTVISALINEVQDLNRYFKKNNLPVKILVLCRMDIFDKLNDPNKNKIKQDNSFNFVWYREGADDPASNPLVSLANMRARLVYPDLVNVFSECFPQKYHKKNIYSALLDFTRHTPRDFIELLNYIKKQCNSGTVSATDIGNGVKEYSTEYFIHEIHDEMAGYIPSDESTALIKCLSSLRKRDFFLNELETLYHDYYPINTHETLVKNLKILYDCSAIGHVYSYDKRKQMITFKYRNRNSSFTEIDRICLHKGLWKALNVIF